MVSAPPSLSLRSGRSVLGECCSYRATERAIISVRDSGYCFSAADRLTDWVRPAQRQTPLMPSDADFTRMTNLAKLALVDGPEWAYVNWLSAKGAGLKAEAKVALGAFLLGTENWSSSDKRNFIRWLDRARDGFDDEKAIVPHPVMTKLILPVLRDWIEDDPGAAEPHLLLGRFHDWKLDPAHPDEHFRASLQRDPAEVEAIRGLAYALLDIVERNQHHLPGAYLGDRLSDVARTDEIISLCDALPDVEEAGRLKCRAAELGGHAAGLTRSRGSAVYRFHSGSRPPSS